MSSFTVLPSAAYSTENEVSTTLSLPNDKPIRAYIDCTAHTAAFTIHIEEAIGAKWFSLGNSGSITATGQYTFAVSAPKTSGRVRVRIAEATVDATFEVRMAVADDVSKVGHASIPLASAARQADANSDPFSLPADTDVLMYVDVTAAAGDDTAVVSLQEEINSKWYNLGSVSITAAFTGTLMTSIAGPRSGGPLRVLWDHAVVTAADNITAEVRLAA